MNYNLLVSFFFIMFAIAMTLQSIDLGLGTPTEQGPGFFPLLSALSIGILSLVYLVSQLLKGKTAKKLQIKLGPHWQKAFCILALSFIYVSILWNRLGYIISTMLWLFFVLKLGGFRSWKNTLIITAAIVITSYLLFQKVGKSFLPEGLFGF
jgi:putative tricarboxylic transport membrane protein